MRDKAFNSLSLSLSFFLRGKVSRGLDHDLLLPEAGPGKRKAFITGQNSLIAAQEECSTEGEFSFSAETELDQKAISAELYGQKNICLKVSAEITHHATVAVVVVHYPQRNIGKSLSRNL